MARSISLKQLRLVTFVIASIGVCIGLYSAFKTDNLNVRSFSLFAATSSLIAGMASYATLTLGEDSANRQIDDIVESQKEALDNAKRLKEDNSRLSVSLKDIQDKHDDLTAIWNDLKGVADDLESKSQSQVQLAKRYMKEHLKEIYDSSVGTVNTAIRKNSRDTRVSDEHRQHIHKVLVERLGNLERAIKGWEHLVNTITSDDLVATCIQILDEIIAHKCKISASATRLNYHNYIPKNYLHKDNALKLRDDFYTTVMEKVNEYDEVAASNEEFMLAAGRDIELLKNRLLERETLIVRLQKPHEFIGGVDQPRVGNAICSYYYNLGYTLDGSNWEATETGYLLYFYKDRNDRYVDLDVLNADNHPDKMKEFSNALNRPLFKQGTRDSRVYLEIQTSYPVKKQLSEADIKLLIGSPEEFTKYVTSNPIRYRLIADPGKGKTPTTAVMVSEILKVGCTKGNTGKGEKVPNTLITVSYPDAESSQKDVSYPLEIFLKYGNTTAAVKSFEDCLEDGKYRTHNTKYAAKFFHIWVWDEFDNTIDSADNPKETGERIKKILKQFGHKNIGWIVSGQSVMTKQLPGFMNDDRRLFTEIIIDIPKIRKYLKDYGNETLSDKVIDTLKANLDKIQSYVEEKNNLVTDDARLLRVALVLDSRSPKLYFLPNLDSVNFDYKAIEQTRELSEDAKRSISSSQSVKNFQGMTEETPSAYLATTDENDEPSSFPFIGVDGQNDETPHCPHCGSNSLTILRDKRYLCKSCQKRFVESKLIWK